MAFRDSYDEVGSGQFFGSGSPTLVLGGIGGIILLLLGAYFGFDPQTISDITSINGPQSYNSTRIQEDVEHALAECTRNGTIIASRANNTICRIYVATSSANTVWGHAHSEGHWSQGRAELFNANKPRVNIFRGQVGTLCGNATSAVGPFYCPGDQTAYFDTIFFDTMMQRLGANTGPLAQLYVVEHEISHHVQTLLGIYVRNHTPGPESDSVRLELQADCFAGFWAYYADKGTNPALKSITKDQIHEVMLTTAAIGDDALQNHSGNVNASEWTHGSSAQRTNWFLTGYQGDLSLCDTWNTHNL